MLNKQLAGESYSLANLSGYLFLFSLTEHLVPLPKWLMIETNVQFTESGMQEEQAWWPPPPAHDLVSGASRKKVTPPKPDTPPAMVRPYSFDSHFLY